ncbi:hypothetical protein J6590_020143 [Homalodisca vitripennis]|nr:hypothetical protein J6590_020143 [Homalodisca vitripennis]
MKESVWNRYDRFRFRSESDGGIHASLTLFWSHETGLLTDVTCEKPTMLVAKFATKFQPEDWSTLGSTETDLLPVLKRGVVVGEWGCKRSAIVFPRETIPNNYPLCNGAVRTSIPSASQLPQFPCIPASVNLLRLEALVAFGESRWPVHQSKKPKVKVALHFRVIDDFSSVAKLGFRGSQPPSTLSTPDRNVAWPCIIVGV